MNKMRISTEVPPMSVAGMIEPTADWHDVTDGDDVRHEARVGRFTLAVWPKPHDPNGRWLWWVAIGESLFIEAASAPSQVAAKVAAEAALVNAAAEVLNDAPRWAFDVVVMGVMPDRRDLPYGVVCRRDALDMVKRMIHERGHQVMGMMPLGSVIGQHRVWVVA